ncbi:hypothetical protein [Methylobacterium bullatum]|uniref:Uncharacterized protein n=1 Tax=Methylobacterium bullatum TaxID=570505 RepID=A0AAV4ZC23_9HYPH|nr:hypothetical protein [Methylobacterium bullatum]MBD8902742.1 hypothetical protein [Methylobacterium bullatum]GJD41352.1 hypothetical protein OICFNHDK_3835 [Methylobacterium bullatum]
MAQAVSLSDLSLGSAERLDGTPVTDSAVIYAGEITIMFDGEGSDALAVEVVRAAILHVDMICALKLALEYWAHRQQRYKNRHPVWVQSARAALAKAEA